ncbi:beta strand repeat-containing protein [Antarctobacter sp.]|uniref:beta strand repeat-containing protein n=1 Tax=Antarctobacter sp. TaxID=1872577 RepID=UPI003A8DD637
MTIFTVSNLNDSGAGSLRDAISQAEASPGADQIVFQSGISGDLRLTSGELAITTEISIDGDTSGDGQADIVITGDANGDDLTLTGGLGHTLTDAFGNQNFGDNSGIFAVSGSAAALTLSHLVLTGGVAAEGGAVSGDGITDVVIADSLISGNKADRSGGGIGVRGGTLTVNDSTISGNATGLDGGGVFAVATSVFLNGATISGNVAGDDGGGVRLGGGALSMTGTVVTGNHAAVDGGGMHLTSFGQISASTISGNTSGHSGGGVHANNGLDLIDSTVRNNSADFEGGGLSLAGDATITGSEILENTVAQDFIDAGQGGGIAHDGLLNTLTIQSSRIAGNAVFGTGGGIHIVGSSLNVTDSEVSGNLASGAIAGGGGIFAIGEVVVSRSTVTGNVVSGRSSGDALGGGIFVTSKADENTGGGEPTPAPEGEEAVEGFGLIAAFGFADILAAIENAAIDGSLTLIQSTVSDNAVRGLNAFGGGIALGDAPATIVSSTISGNRVDAVEVGGAGGVFGAADFINATVHGNSAVGGGFAFAGAVALTGPSTILNSTFTGNAAPDGESIYVQTGATTSFGNTILLGNGAAGDVDASDPADILNLGGNVLSSGAAALVGVANNVTGVDAGSAFNSLARFTLAGEEVLTGLLADNGGPVQTVAIHTMGTARDSGLASAIPQDFFDLDGDNDLAENLPHDARGDGRAVSIFTGLAGTADAGAFEAQGPLLRFEGALLDGNETIILPSSSVNGTLVLDVAATDGAGGSEDSGITYSIAGGNPNIDGDGTPAFAIDPATGVLSVADSGDLQPAALAGTVDLVIAASAGGVTRSATVSVLLDSPLWLSVFGTPPFLSSLGRFNTLQAAFDAAPGGSPIPGGGSVRVDVATSIPSSAFATVTSDNLLFNVGAITDSRFNLALANGIQNLTQFGGGQVTLTGNSEDNILSGGYLATILYGLGGNDTLIGREGDDALIGGTGADDMRGGADNDFYAVDDPGDIVTELADEGIDTISTALDDFLLPDHVETLVLGNGVQRAFGNALNNVIRMSPSDTAGQIIDGGGGRDTMTGGQGDDIYIVDNALDTVIETAGQGIDAVQASVSFDLSVQADHVEQLRLTGTADNQGRGNAGHNLLLGNAGHNLLEGLDGDDTIFGGGGNDSLVGGADNDLLRGDGGDDIFNGGGGINTAAFQGAIDTTVDLGTMAPQATGHGNDVLVGIQNVISGGGNDHLAGNSAPNLLNAGGGNDILLGGAGNDTLTGAAGNDLLRGDGGDDVLNGGSGRDTAVFQGLADTTVNLNLATAQATGHGNDALTGVENVTTAGGNDHLAGNSAANRLDGGAGNDVLLGGAGNDSLVGGEGNDLLRGDGGDDVFNGGGGIDTAVFQGAIDTTVDLGTSAAQATGHGNDVLVGIQNVNSGAGNDHLFGNSAANVLSSGGGADLLRGGAGNDTLRAGSGNDQLVGQGGSDSLLGEGGDDTIDGGAGSDRLFGGADNDVLRGGDGEDMLAGGPGLDVLTGGNDADVFVFASAGDAGLGALRDQILDFETGVDLIDVAVMVPGAIGFRGTSAFAPSGNAELRLFETPSGSTIVQLDTNGDGTVDAEIRVAGVIGLTAGDFVL